MRNVLLGAGGMAVTGALALAALMPVAASADSLQCPAPALSQPFQAFGDTNYYALLPGESLGGFDGSGWQLSGGAQIKTVDVGQSQQAQVLDLPAGGEAVSPPICVTADDYPVARTMVEDVSGNEGVHTYVTYGDESGWTSLSATGIVKNTAAGFAPSVPIQLHSATLTGVHLAQFTLVGGGGEQGEYEIYDFAVDPKMSW